MNDNRVIGSVVRALVAVVLIALLATLTPPVRALPGGIALGAPAATNEWTWMGGVDGLDEAGVYGTQGVAHEDNMPSGHKNGVSWTDSSGRFWFFGGYGYESDGSGGLMNVLWRHDPSTGLWTWISGSDTRNEVGVYGTQGTPHADNVPGARQGSVGWIDGSNQLWLFGGYGYAAGALHYLNDLWRFDPVTGQWTWISGADAVDQAGVYGSQGVPHPNNIPGARVELYSWLDCAGILWLFGGIGYDSGDSIGLLNDLWRFELPPTPPRTYLPLVLRAFSASAP